MENNIALDDVSPEQAAHAAYLESLTPEAIAKRNIAMQVVLPLSELEQWYVDECTRALGGR